MKVRIVLDVEVNSADWELAYGVPKAEQPADVKRYVVNTLLNSAASQEGGITTVKLMNQPAPARRS